MKHNSQTEKIAEIEIIFTKFLNEIKKLRDQQKSIITNFIRKLEEKKINGVRRLLKK